MFMKNRKAFNAESAECTEDEEKRIPDAAEGLLYLFNSGMSFPFGGMGIDLRNA